MSRIEDALVKASQKRQAVRLERTVQAEKRCKSGPTFGKLYWWQYGGMFLFLVLGFVLARMYESGATLPDKSVALTANREQNPRQAVIKPAPLPALHLPSSVLLHSPDPTYSSTHPGWERYAGDALEFRVFRKESVVKAIQVISRNGNVLPDSFVRTFLAEIAGGDLFKLNSGEEKGGFIIERGTAGNETAVVIYRKGHSGKIRAFVVACS